MSSINLWMLVSAFSGHGGLMSSMSLWVLVPAVSGHGGLIFPHIWQDSRSLPLDKMLLPLVSLETNISRTGGLEKISKQWEWFTNYTFVPDNHHTSNKSLTPWSAPGSAPVFGPCGANGGNPGGCMAPGRDTRHRGSRCPPDFDNGAWSFGRLQTEYSFPQAPVTVWRRGSVETVAWLSGGKHQGGYSYRLCRLPRRGVVGLTEDCFQRNPLDFVGDKTELRKLYKNGKGGKWWTVRAQRTTQNTRPKGSQWTKVAEPNAGRKSAFSNHAKIRKDQVLVPLKLRPGSYILSFRWDCEKTPQVWSGCANIKITP